MKEVILKKDVLSLIRSMMYSEKVSKCCKDHLYELYRLIDFMGQPMSKEHENGKG